MAYFSYLAADHDGNLHRGEMEAGSIEAVKSFLKAENLLIVKIKEEAKRQQTLFRKKLSYPDKIALVENLATMVKAGVNLNEALQALSDEANNPYLKGILSDLRFCIENGRPLSEGLAKYPHDFNPVFLNMVKAGEASGKLGPSLERLTIQQKKDYALQSKIRSALIYPLILIGGVIAVMTFVVVFVVPRLAGIFRDTNYTIPLMTRVLFSVSLALSARPILTFGILFGLIFVIIVLVKKKILQRPLVRLFYHLPVARELLKNIELVHFARTVGELLASSINLPEALDIAKDGANLDEYKEKIAQAKEKILAGEQLSESFKSKDQLFPSLVCSVIAVGEKTGKLDELLLSLADSYDDQVNNAIKNLTDLIEPILMVIVGILIGGLALSVIVPVYQLMGSI